MNLRFLEAFLWVARLGSFHGAGEKLNISQSGISSRIATLEMELNCRLFERSTREIRLTTSGGLLVQHAERILEAHREMRDALARNSAVTGTVRIGSIETVVHTLLVPFVEALQQHFPALDLELTAEPSENLREHLRRGGIDIAFQTEPVLDPGTINKPLCEYRMGWIASADIGRVSLCDLAREPIITFPRGSQPYAAVEDAFRRVGTVPNRLHCVTSIAAIVRFVRAGLGVASLPIAAIRQELAAGSLSLIDTDVPLAPLRLYASYRPGLSSRLHDLIVEHAEQQVAAYCASEDHPTDIRSLSDQEL